MSYEVMELALGGLERVKVSWISSLVNSYIIYRCYLPLKRWIEDGRMFEYVTQHSTRVCNYSWVLMRQQVM